MYLLLFGKSVSSDITAGHGGMTAAQLPLTDAQDTAEKGASGGRTLQSGNSGRRNGEATEAKNRGDERVVVRCTVVHGQRWRYS